MKIGDLVRQKREHGSSSAEWGIGYVIKVHRTMYENHVPFVTVIWPKWNKETKGSQAYLEVINEI